MHCRNRFLSALCLLAVFVLLTVKTAFSNPLTREEIIKADGLHKLKCAKCHKLYDPKAYDDADWDRWMGKMRKKARLSDEQYDLIFRYLDSIRKGEGPLDKRS